MDVSDGWSIDEITVVTGPLEQWTPNVPEDFEDGQRDWYVNNGTWEIGPGGGRNGGSGAKTRLGGDYYDDTSSSLIGTPFEVPSADQQPRLRFWHTFNFSCDDYGQFFIRTNGGAWVSLAQYAGHSGGVWSRPAFDLTPYAGQTVHLGFYFYSHNNGSSGCNYGSWDVSSGWYVDDITVVTGPQAPLISAGPDSFERGGRDWSIRTGTWEIGRPTSGPGAAHSGVNCAATVLSGNYWDDTSSLMESPPLVVPTAELNPILTFNHWYSFSCNDLGQVRVWNGTEWNTLAEFSGSRTTWEPQAKLSLVQYAGQTIRLGFYFYSNNNGSSGCNYGSWDVSAGWYIDDIFVKSGGISISSISAKTVNEHETLAFPVTVIGTSPDVCVSYQLIDAPAGATIDPVSGIFSWTPSECQGPGVYNIGIYVVDYCNNEANDLGFVKVTVNEVNQPPWLLPAMSSAVVGQTNLIAMCGGDPDCPANPLTYSLLAPVPAGASIDARTGVFRWVPTLAQVGVTNLKVRVCDGGSPNHCATNTLTITVTTHEHFQLAIQQLSVSTLQFTIFNGRTDIDYVVQQTPIIQGCPDMSIWQNALTVSPTTIPFSFTLPIPTNQPSMFFRAKELPR